MYCGDETGSFIGDVGSHSSRFGYGGEDSPKYVVPSYVLAVDAEDTRTAAEASADSATTASSQQNDTRWKRRTRRSPLTSCYHGRRLEQPRARVTTPLRAMEVSSSSAAAAAPAEPIIDPTQFLSQGDSFADLDALQCLWQSAFDTLRVRDYAKHSNYSLGHRQRAANNNNNTVAASGVTSRTLRSSPPESRCYHPLLVVSPGCTHPVATTITNEMDTDSSSLLITTTTSSSAAARRRTELTQLTELFLEGLDATAFFIAPSPMLAAFSHGRQTALVVDVGAGGCRVTPIVDGLVIKQAQRRNGRGGDWLSHVQWRAILQQQQEEQKKTSTGVTPRYLVNSTLSSSATTVPHDGIFHRWATQDLMYEFRTSGLVTLPALANATAPTPFVYDNTQQSTNHSAAAIDGSSSSSSDCYELPDGTIIDLTTRIGRDLCRVPELLFADEVPFLTTDYDVFLAHNTILKQHPSLTDLSLPRLIHASLLAVTDVDARKELAGSILLTGGASLWTPSAALEQRLSLALSNLVSSAIRARVVASRHAVERSCAAWIGGSILTSLGSFQQLWLSRTEYEEYGATLAVQRFP